ncbi:MAG: gluconate 2-dehydrogenase subunit 3 family protein [Bacteroidota bacterium]
MDRRTALKQSALFAGGLAMLPSCNFGPDRELVALENLQIDLEHQDLLARVIETILPSGKEIPGAESLNLYRFVLVMVDDCEPIKQQQLFTAGLKQFKTFVKENIDQSFPQKDQKLNEGILTKVTSLDNDAEGLKEIQGFLTLARRYTIQGFMGSKYFLTEKFPYKLVPGPYQDCVDSEGLTVM